MKILYCGDSAIGGAANYLLGVLNDMQADVLHLPPSTTLSVAAASRKWDLVILSDYPARQARKAEPALARSIRENNSGLLMLGGWASFSGPFGGWKNTRIEQLLPVTCLDRDDRTNFPGGAVVLPPARRGVASARPAGAADLQSSRAGRGTPPLGAGLSARRQPGEIILAGLDFRSPAAICGFNAVKAKPGAVTILEARPVRVKGHNDTATLRFCHRKHPLLVVSDSSSRSAAFATDLAPHWCAGLVDWGAHHRRLPVARGFAVEVGRDYIRFVTQLVEWAAGHR